MHFDRKSRHLFHIQSLVFSVPSPLLLPEIVCTSSSDTGFRALTKIPRRFRDWGITSVKSLMDSENISGKGWSTQLSCEGSKLPYPDARFLSIFYGDAVDSRQNSWSYLKHGNAMVGYDHFWASRCTKPPFSKKIHENLNGKGQSLNKAITLSEFGAAWHLEKFGRVCFFKVSRLYLYNISYMRICWCQLAWEKHIDMITFWSDTSRSLITYSTALVSSKSHPYPVSLLKLFTH